MMRKIHSKEKVITSNMSCIIPHWYGRSGNNIIQLTKALYFCEQNNINTLIFPQSPIFKTNIIKLETEQRNTNITTDIFYYKELGDDVSFDDLRVMGLKYLKDITNIKINEIPQYKRTAHVRGGDIFNTSNPHKSYIQPPLDYYNMLDVDMAIVEDYTNPIVKHLKCETQNSTLEHDLTVLSNSNELVLGHSTFGLIAFMLSHHIEVVHLPRNLVTHIEQCCKILPSRLFITYTFPDYISEWKNSVDQRELMISYKMRHPTLG